MKKSKILASILIGGVIISGCGGKSNNSTNSDANNPPGSNPTSSTTKKVLNGGSVSDGYIANARVLVDINTKTKGGFDKGDFNTTTDVYGQIIFDKNISVPENTFIYARGGQITSTGEDFNGTLKGVFTGDSSSINLTPITTMVATLVENNANTNQEVTTKSVEEAKNKVAKALDIPVDKVDADPVQDRDALKAVQKVVAIAKVIQSADNNSSISEIIEEIATNLEDNNISKAVEKITDNKEIAEVAIETAKSVEEAIEKLQETNTNHAVIENLVQTHIVEEVAKTLEEAQDINVVNNVLKESIQKIEDNTTMIIAQAMECLRFEVIKGDNPDALSVSKPLELKNKALCEKDNVSIEWIKAEPNNVNLSNGEIKQENSSVVVELEANVSAGSLWSIKPIFFTILPKTVEQKPECTNFNPITGVCEDKEHNKTKTNDALENDCVANPITGECEDTTQTNPQNPNPIENNNSIHDINKTQSQAATDTTDNTCTTNPLSDKCENKENNNSQTVPPAPDLNKTIENGEHGNKTTPDVNGSIVPDTNNTTPDINDSAVPDTNNTTPDVNGSVVPDTNNTTPDINGSVVPDTNKTTPDINGSVVPDTNKTTPDVNGSVVPDTNKTTPDVNGSVVPDTNNTTPDVNGSVVPDNNTTPDVNGSVVPDTNKTTPDINGSVAPDTNNTTLSDTNETISTIEKLIVGFNEENDNLNELLNNISSVLEKSKAPEASVGLALIDLINTIDNELAQVVTFNGESASLDTILKDEDIKVALNVIDNFGDQTETSFSTIANSLEKIAETIKEFLDKNPNYSITHGDTTITADDLKAITVLIETKAAILEYLAAYNIVDKKYIETKTATIDNKEIEYQEVKVDPVTVLNDPTTISLNENAQTHLTNAKEYLTNAINTISSLDISNLKTIHQKKAQSLYNKADEIKQSLENDTSTIKLGEEDKKLYVNLKNLFDTATAPTLANTLGHDFKYTACCGTNIVYDKNLSILENEPMGIVTEGNSSYPISLDITQNSIPQTTTLYNIIKKVEDKELNKSFDTQEDITKYFFGDFKVEKPTNTNFTSPEEAKVVYTILDGKAGSTAPYNCILDYSYADYTNNYNDHVAYTTTMGNSCEVTIDNSISSGTIWYGIQITDAYGHSKFEYGEITITPEVTDTNTSVEEPDYIDDNTTKENCTNEEECTDTIKETNETISNDANTTQESNTDDTNETVDNICSTNPSAEECNTENMDDSNQTSTDTNTSVDNENNTSSTDECQNWNPLTGQCED